jgi:hypothetical protein
MRVFYYLVQDLKVRLTLEVSKSQLAQDRLLT